VRSLLQFVNGEAPFAGDANGWTLTAFFFFDAWLLGECQAGLACLQGSTSIPAALLQQPFSWTVAGIVHTLCACQAARAAARLLFTVGYKYRTCGCTAMWLHSHVLAACARLLCIMCLLDDR
jgi:hypothetical protein